MTALSTVECSKGFIPVSVWLPWRVSTLFVNCLGTTRAGISSAFTSYLQDGKPHDSLHHKALASSASWQVIHNNLCTQQHSLLSLN